MKRFTTFLLTLLLFTLGASAQDYSSKMNNTTGTAWAHGGNTNSTGVERYSTDPYGAGRVLYQTISGLPAGNYEVEFYAVANMAWISAAYGDGIAQVFANEAVQDISVIANDYQDKLKDTLYKLSCTVGVDGILDYGLQNVGTGGNWYVCQGVSLILTEASDATLKEGDTLHGEDVDVDEIGHWSQSFTSTGTYGGLDYNTWSGEAGMTTPYHQVWVWTGEATALSDQTISHAQFTGLPAGTYTVTVDARVLSEANNAISTGSAFFCANDASVDIVAEATTDENFEYGDATEHEVNGTYTLTATVTEDGTLDISFTIKDATYNWISWKNLSVVYEGEAEVEPEPEPEVTGTYEFVAEEWVASDDGRATADKITYNADNTITVAATGANNIALGNNPSQWWDATNHDVTTADYTITKDQSNFVIIGSDLATGSTDSYWWWMNGVNDWSRNNGQIAPDAIYELSDGQVMFVWDLTYDITNNMTVDENGLIAMNGVTCFGLTTTASSSTISDINFYTEEELQAIIASDEEPGTFEPTTVSYTDYLHVVLGSEDEVMEATVDVEYTASNVINFTLYDLAVAGTNVGNVTVTGITLEDAGDGVCTFSYSGNDVTVSGGDFDNLIKLVSITIEISGDITEEKLHAKMTVDVTMGSSSLLSITADFGYSEAPEPEPEDVYVPVYECEAEESHWTTDGTTEIAYNTWSVEEDASGMVAPFLQLWVWGLDATQPSLEAATVSHETLTDLEPGTYEVSLDIRIFSEAGNEIGEGTTFNANEASADLLTEGSTGTYATDDYPNMTEVYGTYVLTATVGEAGTLDISINIPEGVDYNWISWKNLKVAEKVSTADIELTAVEGTMNAEVQAAMEDAIATFESTRTAESYYEAVAAIEAAEASIAYYAPIEAAVAALDEDGAAVWAESDYAEALTNRTLTDEDVSEALAAAQIVQTTAGSDMTYVLKAMGEWKHDTASGVGNFQPCSSLPTAHEAWTGSTFGGSIDDPSLPLYKEIADLPAGEYTISFYAYARYTEKDGAVALAFANEAEQEVPSDNELVWSDATLYTFSCTVGSDGVLDFGLKSQGVGDWFVAEECSLTLVEAAEVEDLSELIAQYEADCTAAEGCEANLADMIENGDKTDETKAEMTEALAALEAVMEQYGNIDTTATTAEELTEAIEAIEAALAEAQDVYATGLQSVTVATENDAIYTLSGVRVSKAVKGVYIVNGKKVLVK